MPLLQLDLTDVPLTEHQRSLLFTGLTQRMSSLLGKRADLTVVRITQSPSDHWALGGQALQRQGWCASLTVHITAGTNTPEEQSQFLASAFALLEATLGPPPQAPVYILFNEIEAHRWGFDGLSQLSRRPQPSDVAA
jgi:4-oxalocrotonate tautomerase